MRPKTYIVDVDGCIVQNHGEGSTHQWSTSCLLVEGYDDWQDQVQREGAYIVLITARPETLRNELERQLRGLGVFWHQLIMGTASGDRVLIDDRMPTAIHHERNAPWR